MSAENHYPMGHPSTTAGAARRLNDGAKNQRLRLGQKTRLTDGVKKQITIWIGAVVMTIAAFALVGATGWMLITLADVLYKLAGE